MNRSNLSATLARIANQSAEAVSDFLRSNNPALNSHIKKALSAPAGHPESLIADPVIEVAQDWKPADLTFGEMGGGLLDPLLVSALDEAKAERMPRDRRPYAHQVAAWEAAEAGKSVLVSSGTGSGKTECFMIPILNDILRNPHPAGGVRAIIVYPLNALIQSQRDRLSAWAAGLGGEVTYALYNGDTPEKNTAGVIGTVGEILDRKSIRTKPPSILVTNITMLEYMLLRSEDQSILQKSQGLLRWIVLDEAHSYVGAQASEMAMLLRRVRSAFGVSPDDVRLMATSATIEDDGAVDSPDAPLNKFMQGLSGRTSEGISVIKGLAIEAPLPAAGEDVPLDLVALATLPDDQARWKQLAPHPRLQTLRSKLKNGMTLGEIGLHCLGRGDAREEAELVLDLVSQSAKTSGHNPFLRWRGHLFLRALSGSWACLDPVCPHRSAELRDTDEWPFGQVHFSMRERCTCGAPAMEVMICIDCGTPHLKAQQEFGVSHRMVLPRTEAEDDFAADVEPDPDDQTTSVAQTDLWVTSDASCGRLCHLNRETLDIISMTPTSTEGLLPMRVVDSQPVCACNETRSETRFKSFHFSPAYLMGQNMQTMIEAFSLPDPDPARKPLEGRGAISFTDSRQGVARLAAKMQAEAERSLTRAFLYHLGHQAQGKPDPKLLAEIAQWKQAIEMMQAAGSVPAGFEDTLAAKMAELNSQAGISWKTAINDLASQPEVGLHVKKVWLEREAEFAEDDNVALARVLLYRELMRRPTRQNSAETMGLARLSFPVLEQAILKQPLPSILKGRNVTNEDYLGLVLSAVDFFFREKMAVALEERQHLRWIAPKWGVLKAACNNDVPKDDRGDAVAFPSARVKGEMRMNRIALNALALTGGSREIDSDLEDADELLRLVFGQITQHAGKMLGPNAWALDFSKAEIQSYGDAWLCPVSRRIFAYSIKGCSPLDASRRMEPLSLPTPPLASLGGLTGDQRHQLQDWLDTDPQIATLREKGIWTGLHDRAVLYGRYMRAQEHSAQLPRSLLTEYEDQFNSGQINLLACSTTMEMGVDLSNVGLVINSNVPPSVSNYRQRVGRAGRRREPWAFGVTWCRGLPLDSKVFENPRRLLYARMVAPQVKLNSRILLERHVNAAALAGWLRSEGGIRVMAKIGPFFGMDLEGKTHADAPVDGFLNALAGPDAAALLPDAKSLLRGSCLADVPIEQLLHGVAASMQALVEGWRKEYKGLIQRATSSGEADVSRALKNRARQMHDGFLLSELAKSGFTPAYGFPSDVVSFEHIWDRDPIAGRGDASRTLDVALREYAPGADIVINSLVYTSEGIRPAWSVAANAGSLEDLRQLYLCPDCGKPHLARDLPESCECGTRVLPASAQKTLRPVGFVGRTKPHIGYELLQSSKFSLPRITAEPEKWDQFVPEGWRMRGASSGQVITLASGGENAGYAICLVCGRAADEHQIVGIGPGPLPATMIGHRPLVSGPRDTLVSGRCLGGETSQRIQRHVHLVHDRRTDVFELQLPQGTTQGEGYALAAALRESLAMWLGVEPAEMGISSGPSKGADLSRRVSAFLFDKAAGGAGLATRLAETGQLANRIGAAIQALECSEGCTHGCPNCILRPDMNMSQVTPDREGALRLARQLRDLLNLDKLKRVFGEHSTAVTKPLFDLIHQEITQKTAVSVTLFVQGKPSDWELSDWAPLRALPAWRLQMPVNVVFSSGSLQDPSLDVPTRLQLIRLGTQQGIPHLTELPKQQGRPILAIIETATGQRGVVAISSAEILPNQSWALGETSVLVSGPVANAPELSWLPAADLMPKTEAGKSSFTVLDKRFELTRPDFGKAFWGALAEDGPALIGILQKEGVKELIYEDRYFLKPIHFSLLKEVFLSLPGRSQDTILRVNTMVKKPEDSPQSLDHNLATDTDREALFDEIFPGERFAILSKPETAHGRNLHVLTANGKRVSIWMDQGFDLWKLKSQAYLPGKADIRRIATVLEQCQGFLMPRYVQSTPMFTSVW